MNLKNNANNISLFDSILSDDNIFSAIYSVESYISDVNLLSLDDKKLFYRLSDKYDKELIEDVMLKCKALLNLVLNTDQLFTTEVYFKPKKWDDIDNKIKYRPIHTASLVTQICIVCLLNKLMFKESSDGKRELSDLSQLIPKNFFGNIPSLEHERIFYDWRIKYKEYTEQVLETHEDALNNHSYKYEVSLDLKNFFPSVNPAILKNYCIYKLFRLYNDNIGELSTVLDKLLYFKVTNLNSVIAKQIYYNSDNIPKVTFSLGIPQGLPQSYHFGNICMTLIYKEFDKIFPGKGFYYVDDSTIFTNSENASEENFIKSIEDLNCNILNCMNRYLKCNWKSFNNCLEISSFQNVVSYEIKVHEEEKSITINISESEDLSRAFLLLVAKETSGIGYDIKNTDEYFEDVALKEKIDAIEQSIDKEIEILDSYQKSLENQSQVGTFKNKIKFCDSYRKSLYRYKKYYKYRKYILEYRNTKDIKELSDFFDIEYFNDKSDSNDVRISIINKLDADNFLAEAQLLYTSSNSNEYRTKFVKKIKSFELEIFKEIDECNQYFSATFKYIDFEVDPYYSLKKESRKDIGVFSKNNIDISINTCKSFLINCRDFISYGNTYDEKIFLQSNEYKRKILNAYISRIFNIYISDDLQIVRKDGRHITYYELCLFTFLRNCNCNISGLQLPLDSLKEAKVGYDIFEIIEIFVTYVKNTEYIEHLMLVHKYISGIWKNGSRFLYFYTLHNQEHSIELIKQVVSLCRVIDYFQLKNDDYYILFLCCYLHDVSMAIQPKVDSFLADNQDTDEISTEFFKTFSNCFLHFKYNKDEIKKLMKHAFEKVNGYFESTVRDNHAYDSAYFIKNSADLSFLVPMVREIVASISEAHAYDTADVYDLKSNARNACFSEKYLMILLRIADLLDGAKDRVSLNILKQNIANMPDESKFHWVTHAITDSFNITSSYIFTGKNIEFSDKFVSVINKLCLHEIIRLTIKVNQCNLTRVKCKNCSNICGKIDKTNNSINIDIYDDKGKQCHSSDCNFLCKWIMTKNNYLSEELYALQKYFNRNQQNLFDSRVKIVIDYSNADAVDSNYYSIVDKKINS